MVEELFQFLGKKQQIGQKLAGTSKNSGQEKVIYVIFDVLGVPLGSNVGR